MVADYLIAERCEYRVEIWLRAAWDPAGVMLAEVEDHTDFQQAIAGFPGSLHTGTYVRGRSVPLPPSTAVDLHWGLIYGNRVQLRR